MFNCWYFIAAALLEVFSSTRPYKAIKLHLDVLFGGVVCPAAILVVAAFWPLFFYHRALIWPVRMDQIIPATYGHMMHTILGINVLIELAIFNHQYASFFKGLLLSLAYAVCYIRWLFFVREKSGLWAYPLFYKMSQSARIMFITSIVAVLIVIYCLQYGLHSYLHPLQKNDSPVKSKEAKTKKVK